MSEAEIVVENTTEEDLKEPTSDSGKQNENVEGLSKRARKRLAKRQLWLDTKAERRQAEKAKKREKIARLKEVNAHFYCGQAQLLTSDRCSSFRLQPLWPRSGNSIKSIKS